MPCLADGVVVDASDPYPLFPDDHLPPLLVADKITASTAIREIGNTLFKSNEYGKATQKYEKALRYLEEEFPSPEERDQLTKAKVPVLLNRAVANLKLKHIEKVHEDCKAVLEIEPTNGKAHMRIGQAYMETRDWDDAIHELNKAISVFPDDKALANLLATAKRQQHEEAKKQAKTFSKMFA